MRTELPTEQRKRQDTSAEAGICLRDILLLAPPETDAYCVHETADECFVAVSDVARLTKTGRKEYAELLNAEVKSIHPGAYGVEIVLRNVTPQLLVEFSEAMEQFEQAEYALGDFCR